MSCSAIEKLLRAMALSAGQQESYRQEEPGAQLLAFIQGREGEGDHKTVPATQHGDPFCAEAGDGDQHVVFHTPQAKLLRYDRKFLLKCAELPICKEMPRALNGQMKVFPEVSRNETSTYEIEPFHF